MARVPMHAPIGVRMNVTSMPVRCRGLAHSTKVASLSSSSRFLRLRGRGAGTCSRAPRRDARPADPLASRGLAPSPGWTVYCRFSSEEEGGVDVHTLRPDGVAPAAAVIARSFNDDPLTVYLYPSEIDRSRFAPLMFEALVRYDCLFGHVDYLDGFSAVATWMPPGETPETPERLAAAGFGELPDEIPLDRLDAFFTAIAPLHEHAISEPHWHLRLLGVDPAQQGGGRGRVLLQ